MSIDLCRCGSINVLVYLFVILFGMSSWVDICGLWVELPILVQNLPEGWDLPSYMSVIIQVANIAPLVYTVMSTLFPHRTLEVPVIYTIIGIGAVSCLLLVFLWDVTSHIDGNEHSLALFVLQFLLALVDCTSSVAFLPFMASFKPQYMTAYFIGEGFSGLIPGLIALGQGAGSMTCIVVPNSQNESTKDQTQELNNYTSFGLFGGTLNSTFVLPELAVSNFKNASLASNTGSFPVYQAPRFSTEVFFLLLMLLLITSGLAFTLLNFWSYCQKERVDGSSINCQLGYQQRGTPSRFSDAGKISYFNDKSAKQINERYTPLKNQNGIRYKEEVTVDSVNSALLFQISNTVSDTSSDESEGIASKRNTGMSTMKYSIFLILTAYLNAISNGLLPSIQTYSCLPYGIQEYHLSVTLASIANPVACLANFALKMKSLTATVIMTLIGSGLTGYIVWTASASPDPPLVHHSSGPVVLILCWFLVVFVITYTKVSMATEFREEGKRALLWIGASTQAGSLLGAVSTFIVVNVLKMFQTGNPCV